MVQPIDEDVVVIGGMMFARTKFRREVQNIHAGGWTSKYNLIQKQRKLITVSWSMRKNKLFCVVVVKTAELDEGETSLFFLLFYSTYALNVAIEV